MAQTTNLGLSLFDTAAENDTKFTQWSRKINAEGDGSEEKPKSDMQKIDEEFGRIYGAAGEITLDASAWVEEDGEFRYNLVLSALGNNDAVFFSPKARADKEIMDSINCFAFSSIGTVTFECDTLPAENITLNYRIVRGAKI